MPSVIRISVGIALILAVVAQTSDIRAQAPERGRGYPSQDWPLAGGNWSGTRYSTLVDITPATVDRLGGAWVTRLEGGAASRATPIILDGVIYLTGGANVFAIDARTGGPLWRWQPEDSVESAGMVPSWATDSCLSDSAADRSRLCVKRRATWCGWSRSAVTLQKRARR